MKILKIFCLIIVFIFSNIIWIIIANAVECRPAWNWNWTTTETCDWPAWKKVFGNIYVQNHTINILAWWIMWIDLWLNRITFTSWVNSKINLSNTSKIDNSVSARYYVPMTFTATTWVTACPAWMHVFYQQTPPITTWTYRIINDTPIVNWWAWSKYHNINKTELTEINSTPWTTWTFYCWTRWT